MQAMHSKRILNIICSETESQCSVSIIYSEICKYFGLLVTTLVAQLRTKRAQLELWHTCKGSFAITLAH